MKFERNFEDEIWKKMENFYNILMKCENFDETRKKFGEF